MKESPMNLNSHNSTSGAAPRTDAGSAEATLRLIAQLPAPMGLEDRVIAGLHAAPRGGRILQWPAVLHPASSWMRGAAAAAIVFVVAGGGWGIYTRVQPNQPTKAIVMPRAGAGGGFSSAGAMRTPQTVNGPVVAAPAIASTTNTPAVVTQPAQTKPLKKLPARIVPMPQGKSKASPVNRASAQPAVSVVK
jgi:hypothetical protein